MVERVGLELTTHSSLFFLKKLFAVSAYLRKEWNMYPLVAEVGLEPTSLSRVVLEATAYANFATQPYYLSPFSTYQIQYQV